MKSFFSKTWFKISVTIILLTIVFSHVDSANLLDKVVRANYYLLFFSLIIFIASNIFGTYSWIHIIHAEHKEVKRYDIFSSYWKGLFFNLLLPTGIGGDIVKAVDIIKHYKKNYFFIGTILLDRIVNFFLLECMGVFAFCLYFNYLKILGLFVVLIAMFTIFLLFFYRWFLLKLLKLSRRSKRKIAANIFRSIIILKYVLSDKKRLIFLISNAFMSQFLKTLVTYIVALALNFNLSVIMSFFVVPTQATVSLIPITINGVGLREFSNRLFEGLPGVSVTELSVISLLGFLLLIISSLPGIYFFFDNRQNVHATKKG